MTSRALCCAVLMLSAAIFGEVVPARAQQAAGSTAARERLAEPGEYRIGPADVLQISVWRNEALSRTVPVRPDGMISFPLVHEIRAAGLTPMQLRDALKKKLAEYVPHAEVSVVVLEVHSFAVSVLGEVKTPGRYEFGSWATVLDVLARAGGVTEFALRSGIVILRSDAGETRRIPFNYNKVIAAPEANENFLVRPGDIVVVP